MQIDIRFNVLQLTAIVALLLFLVIRPAFAIPINYVIYDNNTSLDVGTFTVDPDLASPVGTSNVTMSAFSISESFLSFGNQTVTLADHVGGTTPYVQFLNGNINALSANSQFTQPGAYINVDITPPMPSTPLDFVGILQLVAFTPDLIDFENGPVRGIGIREDSDTAPVPEPSTIILFGVGLAGLLGVKRKRKGR